MTGRVAVIDLGSNTFHLLICSIQAGGSWEVIHKEREYVKLASGGINLIDANAEQRALDAMMRFAAMIDQFKVERVLAIGTAALREASNGKTVAAKLQTITGIPVEIIGGKKEAYYILMGIKEALPGIDGHGLIMDIGGGSVEFILFNGDEVQFAKSFRIGVAVLYETFHHSDPIGEDEIQELERLVSKKLRPLIRALKRVPSYHLIGASGSFEVIQDVLPKIQEEEHWAKLDISGIESYMDRVIGASLSERKVMKEIPEERLDYIVVAYLLIRYIFREAPPGGLYYCEYALKEGVVADFIHNF